MGGQKGTRSWDHPNNLFLISLYTTQNPMFRTEHSTEERSAEAERIIQKYPDRIPIIVQKNTSSSSETLPDLAKTKFLVPDHVTFGQFLYIIRTRMSLPAEKALFIFINNTIPNASSDMKTLYDEHKDEDNFLYCFYGTESTFGGSSQ